MFHLESATEEQKSRRRRCQLPLLLLPYEAALFSRQHVRLATGTADNEGQLIYAHGDLVLVLAKLEHWSHGKMRGQRLVKVAFGLLLRWRSWVVRDP